MRTLTEQLIYKKMVINWVYLWISILILLWTFPVNRRNKINVPLHISSVVLTSGVLNGATCLITGYNVVCT